MRAKSLATLVSLLGLLAPTQAIADEQGWKILSSMEGVWVGTGDGLSGSSDVTQEYELVLGGRFLRVQTRAQFPPQDRNPQGEIHEDIGFFSFDKSRNTLVLRAFYVEGFVNRYVLSEVSADSTKLVFLTEAVENAPPGTQAKLVLHRTGVDTLEESFYVAFPGRELTCYSTNRMTRTATSGGTPGR